jgi:hypothetical protein
MPFIFGVARLAPVARRMVLLLYFFVASIKKKASSFLIETTSSKIVFAPALRACRSPFSKRPLPLIFEKP